MEYYSAWNVNTSLKLIRINILSVLFVNDLQANAYVGKNQREFNYESNTFIDIYGTWLNNGTLYRIRILLALKPLGSFYWYDYAQGCYLRLAFVLIESKIFVELIFVASFGV